MMFDQLDRYRFVTKRAPEGHGGRKFEVHSEIMVATLARDADLAYNLIEQRIRDTSERAIKLL